MPSNLQPRIAEHPPLLPLTASWRAVATREYTPEEIHAAMAILNAPRDEHGRIEIPVADGEGWQWDN